MKNKIDSIRVLLFTFLGIFLTIIVYSALNSASIKKGGDDYIIKAMFSDLKQLQTGDDVRVAGVRVGKVTRIYLDKNAGVAILSIEKKYAISQNSVATIVTAGLLGTNYIAIIPGNAQQVLQPNAMIATKAVTDLTSIIQTFGSIGNRLERILANFDNNRGEIGRSLGGLQEIGNFFRANKDKFDQIIDNIAKVAEKISSGEGTLGKLICDDKALMAFTDAVQSIKIAAGKVDGMAETFQHISQNIQDGNGLIGKLIYDPNISQSFEEMMQNLHKFSSHLNNENSTLWHIISDDSLYKKAEDAIDKVDTAVNGISNSGPITAVGAAASALF